MIGLSCGCCDGTRSVLCGWAVGGFGNGHGTIAAGEELGECLAGNGRAAVRWRGDSAVWRGVVVSIGHDGGGFGVRDEGLGSVEEADAGEQGVQWHTWTGSVKVHLSSVV